MTSNVALSDLEKLSSYITSNLQTILETLSNNVIQIDQTLLYEHFYEENKQVFIAKPEQTENKGQPISIEEFDQIYQQLDAIDAKLSEPKAPVDLPRKKDARQMKRYRSTTDIDKTMMMPPPPPPPSLSTTQLHIGNMTTIQSEPTAVLNDSLQNFQSKVSHEMIASLNQIKGVIAEQLNRAKSENHGENNGQYAAYFETFSKSVARLKTFFEQIQESGPSKPIEKTESKKLESLDDEFCDLLGNLSKLMSHIRYLNTHRNMYEIKSEIKIAEFPLSDEITEIIENYYMSK